MSASSIRPARRGDIPALARLARGTFIAAFTDDEAVDAMLQYVETAFTLDKIEREFDTPGSDFYVVDGPDGLLGYMKLNSGAAQSDDRLENALELQRIYVRRTTQGQGLGRALFAHALDMAKRARRDWIWLAVWEGNADAIRFYQREGLTQFAEFDFPLGDILHRDLMMRLHVSS